MNDRYYSITAYKIIVKDREKGISGNQLANLQNYKHYHDKKRLVNDFIKGIRNRQNDDNRFIEITSRRDLTSKLDGFDVICIGLRYGGKNNTYFSVFHNEEETKFSPDDKIVRDYIVYFFITESRAYMIALRVGVSSCKTAIEKEFINLVNKGNVCIVFRPTSNNEYIKKMYSDCSFSSITYETTYKDDCGDQAIGDTFKKETFSSVSISLSNENTKKSLGLARKFIDLFTGTVKTDVITQIKELANDDKNRYELDEESIRLEIIVNGSKRSVSLSNLNSLMYDVDITNQIRFDDSKNIEWDSLDEIVCEYMKGIITYDE